MDERKPLDAAAIGTMSVLCLIWGLQQVVLKMAAADISPLLQIALRSGFSALLVILLLCWRKQPMRLLDANWRPGLLVGSLFALEFLLVGEGLRFTSASHMVVLLYTAPIFVALGLHLKLPAERLGRLQWLGIGLAFAGIAITVLGRQRGSAWAIDSAGMLWGDCLALLAGAAWGATTLAVRLTRLSSAPATQTLLYQLLGGCLLLTPAAALLGQGSFQATPLALGSLLFQSVVVSFASYLVWFGLLRKYLASRLGVFSFLTPVFGMLFGVVLLNEALEASFVAGTVCVLGGVLLVSGYGWFRQLFEGNDGSARSRPEDSPASQ